MDTFIAGDVRWPNNSTKLHVYFIPNMEQIKDLIDIYRSVIETFSYLSPVPDEWLHATVQMIDHPAARDLPAGQLANLETQLQHQISGLAPFTLTAGGAIAGRSGVVLDLTPDDEFTELTHRTRAVIRDVLGDDSVHYSHSRPHITLGYATSHGDSGVVGSALRNATDQRATLTVTEVSLVDVIQDPQRHQYRWKRLARFSLDQRHPQAPGEVAAAGRPAGLRVVSHAVPAIEATP